MSLLEQLHSTAPHHGLELLESIAEKNGWMLESLSNGDLVMECAGDQTTFSVQFTISEQYKSLHVTCAMDMHMPAEKGAQINDLLAAINARLWIGHFAVMSGGSQPAFRHTVLMWGAEQAKSTEIEEIVETALGECERFYPAFQYAAFHDMDAHTALTCALWECAGEA